MFGKKKKQKFKEYIPAPGEKVVEAKALSDEEVYVEAEVEAVFEAVAEDRVKAEIEEIEFLDAKIDETPVVSAEDAAKLSDAARKIAEAAQKLTEEKAKEEEELKKAEKEKAEKEAQEKIEKERAEKEATEKALAEKEEAEKTQKEAAAKAAQSTLSKEEIKTNDASVKAQAQSIAGKEDEGDTEEEKIESKTIVEGLLDQVGAKQKTLVQKIQKLEKFIDYCVSQELNYKTYAKVAKVLVAFTKIYKDSQEVKDSIALCIKKLLPAMKKAKDKK